MFILLCYPIGRDSATSTERLNWLICRDTPFVKGDPITPALNVINGLLADKFLSFILQNLYITRVLYIKPFVLILI